MTHATTRTLLALAIAFLIALPVTACDDDGGNDPGTDLSDATTAADQTAATDATATSPDTAATDTAIADTGTTDTALGDTGTMDTGTGDTASPDTGADTVIADTGDAADVPTGSAPLIVNELVVTPNAQEALEVYNPTSTDHALDGWAVETTSDGMTDSLPIAAGTVVAAGAFVALTPDDLGGGTGLFRNSGARVALVDPDGTEVDVVAYGLAGDAPAPIFSYSVARVVDGQDTDDDLLDFHIDAGPSIGEANTVFGAPRLGDTDVVINEIYAFEALAEEDFVELYNDGTMAVDISGWQLFFGGDEHVVSAGTVLQPGGHYVLEQLDFPDFSVLGAAGVAYLFDGEFDRVHQLTWGIDVAAPVDGSASIGFVPDGAVTQFWGLDAATQGWTALTPSKGMSNAP